MNNAAQNIDVVLEILRFEKCQIAKAEEFLRERYDVPESDSHFSVYKIFDKISKCKFQFEKVGDIVLWNTFHKFAAQESKTLKLQMSKNFGLTEKGFSEMCHSLRNGDEKVFEQVFLAHFTDCISYLKNNYTISHEDAYDASMETMIVFRKKMINGKVSYGNIRYLFTKMASQIFIKSQNKLKRVDGLMYDSDSSIDEEALQILEKAIEELGDECQQLLKLNYYEKCSIAQIAEFKNKNAGSLRKTKQRCLSKLKNLFIKHSY